MLSRTLIALTLLVSAATSHAADLAEGRFTLAGFVGGEVRVFPNDPAFSFQDGRRAFPSVFGEPEVSYAWNGGDDRLIFTPFGRVEFVGSARNHFDIRLANWTHMGEGWDVVVGIDRVFWGAAESRHLVDIVNQVDQLEDVDEEDRLGQPMVNVNLLGDWGRAGVYVLPGFRRREFFAADQRLSRTFFGIPIDEDKAEFESGAEERHVDFAVRYENSFGPLDVGLSYFRGTSREPVLIPTIRPEGVVAIPFYEQIDQFSLDSTAAFDGWLLKFETLRRFRPERDIFALVGGFEYTFFNSFETGTDTGLLFEYLYDDRDDSAPPTAFDNDVFFGLRLTFNDVSDTNFLVGATVDVKDQGTFLSIEAERRLFDNWRIEAETRLFMNIPPSDDAFGIRKDDFIQIRLVRFL